MAGLVPPELKRRFDERVSPHHGLKQARIGAVINGQQVVQAPGRQGWVYVTLTEPSDVGVTEAINLSTRWAYGAPVYVRRGPRGHMEVVSVDAAAAVTEAGNSATMLTVPDIALTGIVDERRFEPGLVQARRNAGAYTMSVWINSFVYSDHSGSLREYPGGWLDLTTHVPGLDKRRLTLVGVDPVTHTATAIAGPEYGIATTLTLTQVADIDPGGVIPLAAVNLPYGMVAIDSDSYIIDARAFLGDTAAGGTFSGLSDTPGSYAGKAGALVVVNPTESGLAFVDAAGAGPFNVDLPPDTPGAYDDEFDDAALDGAWSIVNDPDDTLSADEAGGILALTNTPDGLFPHPPPMLVRSAPTGDWSAAVKVRLGGEEGQIVMGGICATFPTADYTVYLELIEVAGQTDDNFIYVGMADGETLVDFVMSATFELSGWLYLRLRYAESASLMVGEYSADGLAWSSVQLDISAFGESPEAFGLCLRPWGSALPAEAEFEFFRVVEAFGAASDPVYGAYGDPLAFAASQVGYTPATPGDWPGTPPATVQEALNAIAARLSALEL